MAYNYTPLHSAIDTTATTWTIGFATANYSQLQPKSGRSSQNERNEIYLYSFVGMEKSAYVLGVSLGAWWIFSGGPPSRNNENRLSETREAQDETPEFLHVQFQPVRPRSQIWWLGFDSQLHRIYGVLALVGEFFVEGKLYQRVDMAKLKEKDNSAKE
ncbi:hypothetical protein B0H17DRAFT_1148328 [Mycena rosella]|uniref:Uncharacterized protein n=1 Tax=Mycena rosella TaxID=1033263 RepID=A0AAD7CD20_MYCRO|nr:hypothetical protein B0H17DRAFT_1148328 [Mycena rosella]